jgi:hypothetical protein
MMCRCRYICCGAVGVTEHLHYDASVPQPLAVLAEGTQVLAVAAGVTFPFAGDQRRGDRGRPTDKNGQQQQHEEERAAPEVRQVRVQCEHGWISLRSAAGETMLRHSPAAGGIEFCEAELHEHLQRIAGELGELGEPCAESEARARRSGGAEPRGPTKKRQPHALMDVEATLSRLSEDMGVDMAPFRALVVRGLRRVRVAESAHSNGV